MQPAALELQTHRVENFVDLVEGLAQVFAGLCDGLANPRDDLDARLVELVLGLGVLAFEGCLEYLEYLVRTRDKFM